MPIKLQKKNNLWGKIKMITAFINQKVYHTFWFKQLWHPIYDFWDGTIGENRPFYGS
jgi:hypothetical protein